MESIVRISSSVSEPWVAWTMVVLLLLVLFADHLQRGVIVNSFRSLLTTKDRDNLFATTIPNPLGQLCLTCYKLGVFSLTLYAFLAPVGTFILPQFFLSSLCILGFFVFKYLIARLLAYVFFSNAIFRIVIRNYMSITTCCSVVLYPILLIILFAPQVGNMVTLILFSIVMLFYAILLLIKIFQLFFTQPLASLYIFLYLCTLELIPFIGLYYIGNYVVN